MINADWPIRPLGVLCEKPQYGFTASASSEPIGPRLLRITDQRDGNLNWENVPYCFCDDPTKFKLESGDIVVARIGATTGKTSLILDPPEAVFASYLIRLRVKKELHPFFLYFYTQSNDYKNWIAGNKDNNLKGGVNATLLTEIEVPIPPVPEQEKIAAVLWKVQRAIETEEKLIATARELKRSTMHQLFTRGLRNEPQKETEIGPIPESWKIVEFESAYESRLGKMLSQKSKVGDSPKPYLRNKNVQWGYIDISDIASMDFDEREMRKHRLHKGDLLICEGGVIGRAAIWNDELEECYYQKALHRVRPRDKNSLNAFLAYWLMYAFDVENIYRLGAASSTIAHLPAVQLKSLPIPLPVLTEQTEVVDILQTIDRKISVHERKRATLQELFKTLLHQLMTGEIRVTDLDINTSEVTYNKTVTVNKKTKSIVRRKSMGEHRPDENEIIAALSQAKSAAYIATGGFKHVFRADINGNEEALKIAWLPEDDEDDERTRRVARLEREIDVLRKCTTPALVKLGSVEPAITTIGDNEYFVYSEEWLSGEPLTEVIKTGQQPTFHEALSLTTSLMEALNEINSTDHIHRDVKPANIMATGIAGRPFVLLDLGIAFKVQGTELTGPGAGVAPGTTRYMAPESFSPSYKNSVDIRADIYSAGTTIFEFAAGKHPLVKKYEDVFTTRDRIMNYTPPKLETLRSDLPEWFCLLIDRTIKKNPSLRFRNPSAVLEEIKKNL